jgi:AraC-like DNA-binding protein
MGLTTLVSGASGGMFFWNGVKVSLGSVRTTPHAGNGLTVGVPLDQPISVRVGDSPWMPATLAMPANVVHETRGEGLSVLTVMVDPEIVGMTLPGPVELPGELVARVREIHREVPWGEAAAALAATAVIRWLRTVVQPLKLDACVRQLAAAVYADAPASLPVHEFSAWARRSRDRAGRLFREQMGLTLSAYRLWRRLHWAAAAMCNGSSVTAAAVAAGFADGAHLARATRRFVGMTPRDVASWRPQIATPRTFGV